MLGFDWRSYHQVFGREKRTLSEFQSEFKTTPYFVTYTKGLIVSAYHESVDLSEWVGVPLDEFYKKFQDQEIVAIHNSDMNQWLKQSLQENHFYAQVGHLKKNVLQSLSVPPKQSKLPKELQWGLQKKNQSSLKYLEKAHFIFEAMETWWKKIIPQYFMLFIRVKEGDGVYQEILLEFQNGEWVGCEVPDFAFIHKNNLMDKVQVSKHLKEQFRVPCLVTETTHESWRELVESADPWRMLFTKIRKKEIEFTHSRWQLWVLSGMRAYFGV